MKSPHQNSDTSLNTKMATKKTLNGHLVGQPTASKGDTFHINKSFYVDDSVFLYNNEEDVEKATKIILMNYNHH
jgi:hypothetical protein